MNFGAWEIAKKMMLPFDGGASQIHVLGLAKSKIGDALSSIENRTTDSQITLLANNPMDSPISLKSFCSNITLLDKVTDGQTTISTKLFASADIIFDLWGAPSGDTYDLEVWFWADQLFIDNDNENRKRFSFLLDSLKVVSSNGDNQCILTPNEASDPLKDLDKGYGVLLDIRSA